MSELPRSFSAPGKLVLIGEYAVTDGFPAVVAAVDRRATACVIDGTELRVRGDDPRWLTFDDDGAPALASSAPLLFAVLREVQRRGLPHVRAHIAVSTMAFRVGAQKLGLGSSAAAAVAFTAALCQGSSLDVIYHVARTAHRIFQGGGSGIDIAASTYGGLLRVHEGRAQPTAALPQELALVVAWTGIPAQTQGFIDAYQALPQREQHARAIDCATTRFLTGAARNDASEVLAAISDARLAMERMGRAAGIDVVTAEHQRIAELTRAAGGQAKPSGAGGGDVAVCLVPQDACARLKDALAGAGFAIVDVTVGAPGVRLDASQA